MTIGDCIVNTIIGFLFGVSAWIVYIIGDLVRIQVSNFIEKRQIKKAIRDELKRRTDTAP